jgi:hypothetical protein
VYHIPPRAILDSTVTTQGRAEKILLFFLLVCRENFSDDDGIPFQRNRKKKKKKTNERNDRGQSYDFSIIIGCVCATYIKKKKKEFHLTMGKS